MDELFIMPEISEESKGWISSLLPEFSAEEAVSNMLKGQFGFDTEGLFSRFINLFLGELRGSLKVLALLLAMGIFLGILRNLQSAFGRESLGSAANLAAAAYLTAIALEVFSSAKDFALTAVDDLSMIMDAILPLTLSLMMSGGMAVSGGAIHPVIYFMCSLLSAAVKNIAVPLSLFSMALYILGSFGGGADVSALAQLLGRIGRYSISFVMVIFTGVLSITRFAAASFDSLAARGLKFAVSSAVPVVGGSIADAMNSVAGGSILMKNSVGAAGAALLVAVALLPVVKIGALSLVFRLGGALMGTLGGDRIGDAVCKMAGCLEMLVASVASVAVMMVIAVAALMGG